MAVQQIDGSNDIGKDLYVDLAEPDGRFTGELIALQVKSGKSYGRAHGYAIRCDAHHANLWANSTVPVFGVVFDPGEDALFWVNLTETLQRHEEGQYPTSVPVAPENELNASSLGTFLRDARAFLQSSRRSGAFALAYANAEEQRSIIFDLFASGRRNAAPLLYLRVMLQELDGEPFDAAVQVLALCAGHPDIFWTPKIWVDDQVRARVRQSMHWTYDELVRLLSAPQPEEWERGGQGQNVAALVECGWDAERKRALEAIVMQEAQPAAWAALMLLIQRADTSGLRLFEKLMPRSRSLRDDPAARELGAVLRTHGFVSIW